jgi:hypothetical protein
MELLDTMVGLLGDIADDLVFIGGCATGLWVTAIRVQSVRVTTDVDVVTEAMTIREYHIVEARLRQKKFEPDPEVIWSHDPRPYQSLVSRDNNRDEYRAQSRL